MSEATPTCPRAEDALAAVLGLGEADPAHLATCALCAGLSEDAPLALSDEEGARRKPAPAVWERLESALEAERYRANLRVVLGCAFCHDRLAKEEAVYCASCLTPHHSECFATHGKCSAMGCGETEVVRSRSGVPDPAQRETPRSTWVLAAAALLGALSLGQAAWSNLRHWDRPIAPAPVGPAGSTSEHPPSVPAPPAPSPDASVAPAESRQLVILLLATPSGGLNLKLSSGEQRAAVKSEVEALWAWVDGVVRARRERLGGSYPLEIDASAETPVRHVRRLLKLALDAELGPITFAARGNSPLDLVSYSEARAIVEARELSRYAAARELLESVDPSSEVYLDARALLGWLEADESVREAHGAFREGNLSGGFGVLERSLAREDLSPTARERLEQELADWSAILQEFERAFGQRAEGDFEAARQSFRRLNAKTIGHLQLRAKQEEQAIAALLKTAREQGQARLRAALLARDWGGVHEWASLVAAEQGHASRPIAELRETISRLNREERLLKRCERRFMRDEAEDFVAVEGTLRMLAKWLPEGESDRAEARKLLKKLLPRIRNWNRMLERD